jgi:ferredoxin--NADP+ reductase
MANLGTEQVLSVRHWNDTLFSFTTTRSRELRFENGHFVMVGLEVEGKPLTRAYSIASANYEDHLEFFSIKVPDGPLTSRLQHLKANDEYADRPQAGRHAGAARPQARQRTSICSPPAPASPRS